MPDTPLKIMVLAGGPDRERDVSLQSGRQVADALKAGGHTVYERDISPTDLSALDDAEQLGVHAVFPVMHGRFGEGGPLQQILADSRLAFVGSTSKSAQLCMDKWEAKRLVLDKGIPTPEAELLSRGGAKRMLRAPVVVKAIDEGSSYALEICHDELQADAAVAKLFHDFEVLMVERLIDGMELTVGIIEDLNTREPTALPTIHIVPATEYYDYEAKYTRDDTQYRFDLNPPEIGPLVQDLALRAYRGLDCRHLARIDFMVDAQLRPWFLEANTMPGATSHSLLPKAAAHAGIAFPALCDRLVRLSVDDG